MAVPGARRPARRGTQQQPASSAFVVGIELITPKRGVPRAPRRLRGASGAATMEMGWLVDARDVYLKIETVPGYSPLAPVLCSRRWGRDCMRLPGHELGRVTPAEIFASTVDAVVYREYSDPGYTQPVTTPLIGADENEPPWDRRVPGCVLFADPGDRLR